MGMFSAMCRVRQVRVSVCGRQDAAARRLQKYVVEGETFGIVSGIMQGYFYYAANRYDG